jgi:hypothetical protein
MTPDRQVPATNLVPELAAFRADLEELGYVVVPHGDHLCVRLPQFASVRVKLGEDGLQFVPQFGPLLRHHSSALTLGGASAAVAVALALTGMGVIALGAAFVGTMLAARDVGRYIVTEGCITRLQLLWTARGAAAAHPSLRVRVPPTVEDLRESAGVRQQGAR